MEYKEKHLNAQLLLGLGTGEPLNLTGAKLLDSDEHLDLAVIELEVDASQLRTKAFYPIHELPISQAAVGDAIAIAGFPGSGRKSSDGTIVKWSPKLVGCGVSAVSPRGITLAPERNDRKNHNEYRQVIPHDDLGGMSGSPAFLMREQGPLPLVGFLYEGAASDSFIFLRSGSCLQDDGTLRV